MGIRLSSDFDDAAKAHTSEFLKISAIAIGQQAE
jgi:hypothetical protein